MIAKQKVSCLFFGWKTFGACYGCDLRPGVAGLSLKQHTATESYYSVSFLRINYTNYVIMV